MLVCEPRDRHVNIAEAGGREQEVVGTLLESDFDVALADAYESGSIDEVAEDVAGLGVLVAL